MATKKVAAKVAAKKPAPKKAAAASKKIAPVKKTSPAKKIVISKKTATAKKAVAAKKGLSVKKVVVTKKIAKSTTQKNIGKKMEVSKKVISKKSNVTAKKAITPVNKKIAPKANNSKANKSVQKSQPIKVTASKKLNKPVAKVANTTKVKILTKKDNAKALNTARLVEKAKKETGGKKANDSKKLLVLPKLGTKASRKYEPDFTKSVLDKAPADPGAPIVMYSDADLADFKDLILRKLGAAKKELAYLQGLITRKDDTGGDDSDGRYMTMEDGSLSMEREQLSQMASRQITFVDHLEKALIRIENKTYGVCRVTGKLIDKARLRAVPHATLSIEAKMGVHK